MDKYVVNITDRALADMEKIYNYIANELLAPERSWNMRHMVIDNYLVCYMVDQGVVTVTDVLYGASNVHARLLERHP